MVWDLEFILLDIIFIVLKMGDMDMSIFKTKFMIWNLEL